MYSELLSTKHHGTNTDYFLYDDQEEIGRWKDHALQELRVTSPNKHPSTIAIELNGKAYIPIHDLIGHIVLLHDLDGNIVEQYRYTAFGERDIFEKDNTPILTSAIGNPWQYSEKRFDEESGLLAFGLRYYDPKIGRWITQDPAEFEDGPNRYAYVHNNPLLFYDRYGLFAEEGSSFQENRFFQNMWSASAGAIHGAFDYGLDFLDMINTSCYHVGAGMMEFEHDEHLQITAAFEAETQRYMDFAESTMQNFLRVDVNDPLYQNFRTGTKLTLDVGSLAFGGASIAKSAIQGVKRARGIINATRSATPYCSSLARQVKQLDLTGLARTTKKPCRARFKPSKDAEGAHTVFRRDPITKKVTHYETYIPQTNPYNPKPWQSVKRFDGVGEGHTNKILRKKIATPHVHDPAYPGGVRKAEQWELPR